MTIPPEHTVTAARDAALRDELADWVADFLASPGSDNAPLAEKLSDPPWWWIGPVRVPIDRLGRLAGPPGHPVLQEVEDHEWRDDVDDLAEIVEDEEPPPVIATWADGDLHLEDGNHRVEALRRAGAEEAWTVVGFPNPTERDRWIEETSAGG